MFSIPSLNICCPHSSIWYLRKSSYQSHFYKALSEHFPDSGERVMVYVGGVRYWEHGGEMRRIQAVMDDSDYIRNRHPFSQTVIQPCMWFLHMMDRLCSVLFGQWACLFHEPHTGLITV